MKRPRRCWLSVPPTSSGTESDVVAGATDDRAHIAHDNDCVPRYCGNSGRPRRRKAKITANASDAAELQQDREEIQALRDEPRSSREELQSANEELQAINSELQTKLDDLALAQRDMKNVLNSIEISILFLDQDLNVRRYTDRASKIFNLRKSDIGRPLSDLTTTLQYLTLHEDALETLRTL